MNSLSLNLSFIQKAKWNKIIKEKNYQLPFLNETSRIYFGEFGIVN